MEPRPHFLRRTSGRVERRHSRDPARRLQLHLQLPFAKGFLHLPLSHEPPTSSWDSDWTVTSLAPIRGRAPLPAAPAQHAPLLLPLEPGSSPHPR